MARKYTRDNRGRFASGGGGATARGGRLRTASGNKRATQTMKAQGAGGVGVMKGAVKRDAGAMAKRTPAAPKAAQAKVAPKLAFGKSDFERRAQRTVNIRNPEVKQKAHRLYGKILDITSTPKQLKNMFRKAGKPKAVGRSALDRQRQREHKALLAAAPLMFR